MSAGGRVAELHGSVISRYPTRYQCARSHHHNQNLLAVDWRQLQTRTFHIPGYLERIDPEIYPDDMCRLVQGSVGDTNAHDMAM